MDLDSKPGESQLKNIEDNDYQTRQCESQNNEILKMRLCLNFQANNGCVTTTSDSVFKNSQINSLLQRTYET